MDLILIFVVLPLATIIFSIALQRLLKCPILVSAIIFAIFLILTYTVFGTDFIIYAILFAILAFITAFLVNFFSRILNRLNNLERRNSNCNCNCNCDDDDDEDDNANDNLLTISSRCGNGENTDLLTISTGGTCGRTSNNNSCGCNNNNTNERIVLNAEVAPSNSGRSGCFRGAYRRR